LDGSIREKEMEEHLEAGFGEAEFTPAGPVPLAGYTHWKDRMSTGVRDPLFARALALRGNGITVVLVAYDLLMVTEDLYQGVRSRLADTGARVMVHGTHTHSSVGGFWNSFLARRFLGTYDPGIVRMLLDAGERAARAALGNLEPAEALAASAVLPGLNGNRRDPAGPKDEEITVLRLRRRDSDGILVSYPAHPVIVAERDHHRISADFPGEVVRMLRQDWDFAVFVQGSLGGVDVLFPDDPAVSADDNLQRMASPLATAATTLARGAEPVGETLRWESQEWTPGPVDPRPFFEDQWQARVDLPLRWLLRRLVAAVPRRGRVQGLRVGGFGVVGFQADLGVSIGLEVKRMARERGIRFPIAASQTDGYLGYLHRAEDYRHAPPESHRGMAVYENAMNFFGRRTGEEALEAARAVIGRLA